MDFLSILGLWCINLLWLLRYFEAAFSQADNMILHHTNNTNVPVPKCFETFHTPSEKNTFPSRAPDCDHFFCRCALAPDHRIAQLISAAISVAFEKHLVSLRLPFDVSQMQQNVSCPNSEQLYSGAKVNLWHCYYCTDATVLRDPVRSVWIRCTIIRLLRDLLRSIQILHRILCYKQGWHTPGNQKR